MEVYCSHKRHGCLSTLGIVIRNTKIDNNTQINIVNNVQELVSTQWLLTTNKINVPYFGIGSVKDGFNH